MASHAITALLALTTGLLFPDNIFDYISGVFNQNRLPEQAPTPAGIISATKTIKFAADTAVPRLDLDFHGGEGTVNYFPLVFFVLVLVLSLLGFAYVQRLAQDAEASFLIASWRSALQAAAEEISDFKEVLKARAAQISRIQETLKARAAEIFDLKESLKSREGQLKAYEDQIAELTDRLCQLSVTVTNLDSDKNLQMLLYVQQQKMLTAREKEITCHVEHIHGLEKRLSADQNLALENYVVLLDECLDRQIGEVEALSRPEDTVTDAATGPEDGTTTATATAGETEIDRAEEVAGMADLTKDISEDADDDDDDGSTGEGAGENGRTDTGGKKKPRRRKRGKRKGQQRAALTQPPANAPKGPRAMGY